MRSCVLVVASLIAAHWPGSLPAAESDYKVSAVKEAPAGLSPEITSVLNASGYRVEGKDGVICDIWLAKEVPLKPKFTQTLQVKYPFLAGQLIGAIRFPEKVEEDDFRGQPIAAGTYTLRYGQQPNDGNHLGTSEVRDFVLACPPKMDTDPKRIADIKDLFKLSAKAAGTTHPAIFLLTPPPEKPAEAAAVSFDDEKKLVIVHLQAVGKDSDQTVPVPLNVVVVGKSAG